jgi:hypothetical protein
VDLDEVKAETERLSTWAHLATVGADGNPTSTAAVHTDLDTKRRPWTGVFTYNLEDFAPEGMDSAENCFIAVRPERVLALKQYGMAGRDTWQRT